MVYFKLQLTDGEDLLALSTYDSALALICDAFIEVLTLYSSFGILLLAWDHLYLIHCSPYLFPWVLYCCSFDISSVIWMNPNIVLQTPLIRLIHRGEA